MTRQEILATTGALRLKDISVGTADVYKIPVQLIRIEAGFNFRHDTPEVAEHIQDIYRSIMGQGYDATRPITVRLNKVDSTAVIVDGHCRFAAVRLAIAAGAEILDLPCLSEGKNISPEDRTLRLFTANAGLPFSPLDQAEGIRRLMSFGWTQNEIAEKIGKTRQHVAGMLELAGAPKTVKAMVVDGTISATEAVKTVRRQGHQEATKTLVEAVRRAKEEGRVRATPRIIEAVAPRPDTTPRLLQSNAVPLSVAAAHVVAMAKGVDLPDDLARAIAALAESLS